MLEKLTLVVLPVVAKQVKIHFEEMGQPFNLHCYMRNTQTTLQRQITEILKQIFPEKEYRGLSPNFHIHASLSDFYIQTIGLPILLEEICRPILGLYKSLTDT
jgi:hypothetical protein